MDMGLARERRLATQFTTGTFDADVERNFHPITRKFAVFATLTAIIVTTVILLVLFKDLNWLLNTPSLDPNEAKMAVLKEIVFIAAVFLAYVVNLIFSYSHNLKRLMDEENRALKAVSEGDLSHLVTVYTNDEFGIMGRYTNQMIRELDESRQQLEKAHNQLVESERLRAIGEFASSIVHEIRSPLNVVQMMLDYFDKQELADGGRKRLQLARTEVTRLTGLMSEILLYAKPQRLEREEVDLAEALGDWIDAFEALPCAAERKIELHLSGQPVWIRADPDKVKQALINLVSNACEAAPKGGSVRIHLDNNKGFSQVEVRNHGTPIPAEQLRRLTEPFFTTKQGGTGLGLAIVKRIMDAHEGLLSVTSSATAGTRVALSFPGRAGAAGAGTDGRTRAPSSS
jgi:signal transduction histidine kinase